MKTTMKKPKARVEANPRTVARIGAFVSIAGAISRRRKLMKSKA